MANEKRLIDANELLRDAEDYGPIMGGLADMYDIKWLVDAQTTVDAVEVVRCKDCKHYNTTMNECESLHFWYSEDGCLPVEDDDFCSYGERKDNA